MSDNKQPSVLRSLDWWTIGKNLALLALAGSVSVVPVTHTVTMKSSAWVLVRVCRLFADWNIDSIGFGSSFAR